MKDVFHWQTYFMLDRSFKIPQGRQFICMLKTYWHLMENSSSNLFRHSLAPIPESSILCISIFTSFIIWGHLLESWVLEMVAFLPHPLPEVISRLGIALPIRIRYGCSTKGGQGLGEQELGDHIRNFGEDGYFTGSPEWIFPPEACIVIGPAQAF